jgi:hypothetical protein
MQMQMLAFRPSLKERLHKLLHEVEMKAFTGPAEAEASTPIRNPAKLAISLSPTRGVA